MLGEGFWIIWDEPIAEFQKDVVGLETRLALGDDQALTPGQVELICQ